ncbi:hypothetical protein EDC61_10924 [Sulfuritortus calidifontis]|uniref:Uncharacterized protein n=2 Tax=Sulfuritortus calidifontis TaxID=1914471 RepID=A0A4R3JUH7_9PROT|nr:hypothetical protein EDC61_10924 [Sulfuritortus calidifontis]
MLGIRSHVKPGNPSGWFLSGYVLVTVNSMKIKIDEERVEQMQTLTTIPMLPEHVEYFADFLMEVGFATVNEAMRRHPGLTFGDLVMIRFRINHH